jgi:hypothetical protein
MRILEGFSPEHPAKTNPRSEDWLLVTSAESPEIVYRRAPPFNRVTVNSTTDFAERSNKVHTDF